MLKKSFPIFIFLFIGLSANIFAQREIIEKVIAHVGSEIVMLSELEEQHALVSERQGNLPANARCFILDQIMTQKLLGQALSS